MTIPTNTDFTSGTTITSEWLNGVNDFVVITKDVTGNRPISPATGFLYLDTTLAADGKPIWYNGSVWVDATGSIV